MVQSLPARDWKRALAAVDDEHFHRRAEDCDSVEYLRAAVKYEAEEHGRAERIGTINQRINDLQA